VDVEVPAEDPEDNYFVDEEGHHILEDEFDEEPEAPNQEYGSSQPEFNGEPGAANQESGTSPQEFEEDSDAMSQEAGPRQREFISFAQYMRYLFEYREILNDPDAKRTPPRDDFKSKLISLFYAFKSLI